MKTIPLSEHVENGTQTATAKLLGLTQAAVRAAVINGRKVFLTFDDRGQFVSAYEVKPYPAKLK